MNFSPIYEQQVRLLLRVLPEVAQISDFAMHGGTAINLFHRNLPRLSVDIDLTYVPIEPRKETLQHIAEHLQTLQHTLESSLRLQVQNQSEKGTLLISDGQARIKIEVNLVKRGCLAPPQSYFLCDVASNIFDAFVEIPIVSLGQLYGGKSCAALDRQHPRDLFDIKLLLENEGFTDEIKEGFLLYLLGASRPVHELLAPNLTDQRTAFANHFQGMSHIPFSYDDFEQTRMNLIDTVTRSFSAQDKDFILKFHALESNWDVYDFKEFPSIRWKVLNLQKLQRNNPSKFEKQHHSLSLVLNSITPKKD
jgi:predicted nucleotidyltransferase component of viral defense system